MDEINVDERDLNLTSKDLRQARKQNRIPAAIYGKDVSSTPVFIKSSPNQVNGWKRGRHFKVKVDGKSHLTSVDEIQRDPVTKEPLHVSLHAVSRGREIKVEAPIVMKGDAKGKKKGGLVTQTKKFLSLKGKFKDLPEQIEVDVSDLDVNEHLEVKDIALPEGVELLEDNLDQNVIACAYSNVSMETSTEETTPEETETSGASADSVVVGRPEAPSP